MSTIRILTKDQVKPAFVGRGLRSKLVKTHVYLSEQSTTASAHKSKHELLVGFFLKRLYGRH